MCVCACVFGIMLIVFCTFKTIVKKMELNIYTEFVAHFTASIKMALL